MIAAAPLLHQTENHIIDAEYYWTKTGEFPWVELRQLVDEPEALWSNGDSTYYGLNDRFRLEIVGKMTNSLVLIQPKSRLSAFRQKGLGLATLEGGYGLISYVRK